MNPDLDSSTQDVIARANFLLWIKGRFTPRWQVETGNILSAVNAANFWHSENYPDRDAADLNAARAYLSDAYHV